MYNDILLPVDLNQESSWRGPLQIALEYARAFDARLHIMTVLPDFGMAIVGGFFPRDFENRAIDEVNRALHGFVQQHVPDDVTVQHIVGHGTVYEEILKTANAIGADLIIMHAHRPELRDYLLGPNAARVVRHSNCSVLVVRD